MAGISSVAAEDEHVAVRGDVHERLFGSFHGWNGPELWMFWTIRRRNLS